MLIKLPIIKNNFLSFINFSLQLCDRKFILYPCNRNNDDKFEIIFSNLDFCLTKIGIVFPIELEIVDLNIVEKSGNSVDLKGLFSDFFGIINITNRFKCELDFFYNILTNINSIKDFSDNKYIYANTNFIETNLQLNIKNKLEHDYKIDVPFKDIQHLKLCFYKSVNIIFNLFILAIQNKQNLESKPTLELLSKVKINEIILKDLFDIFLEFKIKFNGSSMTSIKDHILNLTKNKNVLINGISLNMNPTDSIESNYNNELMFDQSSSRDYYVKIPKDRIIKIDNCIDRESTHLDFGIKKIEVSKCSFFKYNPEFSEDFSIDNLIRNIIDNEYDLKLFIFSKIFPMLIKGPNDYSGSDYKEYTNLFKYLFNDNNNKLQLSSLNNLNIKLESNDYSSYNINESEFELEILDKGFEDKNFLIYLNEKYKDDVASKLKILAVLFKNYNFPLTFNKKRLNSNFELIMYFSFLNFNMLVKIVDNEKIYLQSNIISIIPSKLKNLFYNLLKFYYQYQNDSLENITYNFKFYQDYIYIYIIKNIIQKTTIISELFRKNETLFNNLIAVYKKNFILNQMIRNITWNNISNRLNYLDYFYKCEDLIFYQGKVNKNLFDDDVDFKVKNILIDKFAMYKYLKNEKDFVRWTRFIKGHYLDLYEKPISVTNEDLINLGKLIYMLLNLTTQDLKDEKYKELIDFCQKNKKLILQQSRINLKIKEKLPMLNCQLNLGYFAKHLNFNNHDKIVMDNKIDESESIDVLKDKLKTVTKKYHKYKGKYIKFKSDSATNSNSVMASTTIESSHV